MPQNAVLPPRFFGNYFCLIPNTNLAFVVIAKNGVTFLKKVAHYNDTGRWVEDFIESHDVIGYTEESPYLIPVEKMSEFEEKNGKRIKFAIWRDPLERVVSTYKLFCLEKQFRTYFHFIGLYHDNSFENFMRFMEFEWTKKYGEIQDEHIRSQIDYYDAKEVDFILPVEKMYDFLKEHKVPFVKEQSNKTDVVFNLENQEYIDKIREYYEGDYNILCNY